MDETMKSKHKTTIQKSPSSSLQLPCLLLQAGCYADTKDVGWHVHSGHEIILVTEGHCRMSAGRDLWFEGTAGTLYILPAGASQYHHSYEFTKDLFLVFRASAEVFNPKARTLQVPLDGLCARLFNEIFNLSLSPTSGDAQPVLNALLLALLEEVSRLEHRKRTSGAWHPAVQTAVKYIEANLARPLTVMEVARNAGTSASHLSALFRHELNESPMKLHARLRMELAAKLLRGRMGQRKEVAEATGFQDTNYFSRMFRSHFGLAPAAWLRQQDGDK